MWLWCLFCSILYCHGRVYPNRWNLLQITKHKWLSTRSLYSDSTARNEKVQEISRQDVLNWFLYGPFIFLLCFEMFLAFFCISICDGYQTVVPHHQIRRPLSLAGRDSYATCSETQHLYLNATLIIIESLDIAMTSHNIPQPMTFVQSLVKPRCIEQETAAPSTNCQDVGTSANQTGLAENDGSQVTVESLYSHFQIFERMYTENGTFMGIITCTYELETSSTHYTLYVFYW